MTKTKITVAQGLKLKSRLAGEFGKVSERIRTINSKLAHEYNEEENKSLWERRSQIFQALVEVKVLLSSATQKVRADIYTLAELKGYLDWFADIQTQNGMIGRYSAEKEEWKAFKTEADIQTLIRQTQKRVNELQDSLDTFNASHHIEIVASFLDLTA